jgi:hypothetical protein
MCHRVLTIIKIYDRFKTSGKFYGNEAVDEPMSLYYVRRFL